MQIPTEFIGLFEVVFRMQADENGPYFGESFKLQLNIEETQKFTFTTDYSASVMPLDKKFQGEIRVAPGKSIDGITIKFKNNHSVSVWPETTVLYQKEDALIIEGKSASIEAGTRGPNQYKNLKFNIIAPSQLGKHIFNF